MMQQQGKIKLSAEAFVEWAMEQPSGRFELLRGEVIAMAPERVVHARTKRDVLIAFHEAVSSAGLDCEVFGDGMAVRIDESTVYEPDATIRCGSRLSDEAVLLDDPVAVVEVISPSSQSIDTGTKLTDYFRLDSVRHYLVVQTDVRRVTHHHRTAGGQIETRIFGAEDALVLDRPGIEVSVRDFFAAH